MSAEELAALAAETGAAPEPAPETSPEPDQAEVGRDGLIMAASMGVAAVGQIVTSRYKVSALTEAEVQAVAGPLVAVMALYDWHVSPAVAAWGTLGLALAGVMGPRMEEHQEREAAARRHPQDSGAVSNGEAQETG